ncbi:MAG: beta strand repeat-containing protein [Mariniblastus sp.]
MLLPFGKSRRQSSNTNRKRSATFRYDTLEDRQVLASIVGFDAPTGALTVDLTGTNDVAQISILNNNVAVNGSDDLSAASGTQSAAFTDVRSITITGDPTFAGQNATFLDDFSNANGANIQSISVTGVNNATFLGNYQMSDLNVVLERSNGQVSDGTDGQVRVSGTTTIVSNNNSIVLNNFDNDFGGNISASSGGIDRGIVFSDANSIQFSQIDSSGDFRVNSGGAVTDELNSVIQVAGDGFFSAGSVTLGDSASDIVNFARINSSTLGDFTLTEDSNVVLLDVNAENLNVSTAGAIFDGRFTTIDVRQTATFDGQTRIRIGENGGDTFNASSVNFNSTGHVHIWEDSGTNIIGSNTAQTFNLYSEGTVTDDANASVNIVHIAGFEGTDVILGDTATDTFNAGSIYFNTPGDFSVSEDSATLFTETKNQARRLFVTSTDAIQDSTEAQITVERIATFTAPIVNLGDSGVDSFNAGSIMFTTTGQFRISENSATNIVGLNSAENAFITSAGEITDVFVNATSGIGTTISVTDVASFSGTAITLGNEANDEMNFGSLQLNSPGIATVTEDSATHLAIDSSVAQLNLVSGGAVTDALTGSVDVVGLAQITGTSITIGESANDSFNATSVTLNSTGDVLVTEDSGMNLSGVNSAANMTLVANGNLTDSLTAQTRVTGLLNLSGQLINMGSEATDVLEMGTLQFNSNGPNNTFLTADSDINLTGTSFSGNRLLLTSSGNITDSPTADVQATTQAVLQGVDVIIGELATDCFDILNGGASNLFVLASGISDVTVGCP